MISTSENGIETDGIKSVAKKVIAVMAAEKCTVGDAREVIRCVGGLLNDSPVAVQEN